MVSFEASSPATDERYNNLTQHPDLAESNVSGPALHRNKTERRRLQGIQKVIHKTMHDMSMETQRKTVMERFNVWLINDGGKKLFFAAWILLHLLVAVFGFCNYWFNDDFGNARGTFGYTFATARASALVLHVDLIFILLPVCRNLISLLRQTPLNGVIPFDNNLDLHKATGWAMVVGTLIHIGSHMVNFYKLAASMSTTRTELVVNFLDANFGTGPGATGWVMTACLGIMVFFAREKQRRKNFERFWYSHHLFIIFFVMWQLHGMFCMIKPDRPPFCSFNNIGVFWRYWLVGGVIWIFERILREVRARHLTFISKVIRHPSQVMELQIKKNKIKTRAGQYIFLSCPEISYFQWHPFTLTSAPEEDYISVHIRVVGDFTRALAKSLGCDFPDPKSGDKKEKGKEDEKVVGKPNATKNPTLPRVMVDGPFGSASEDFLNYETVLLVGAGIGVTPFASILKSIWYRMNNLHHSKPTRLSKVYFTWVIRDYGSAEWFRSLLQAIEEQDVQNRIEINIYLTAKIKEDDMNNIMVRDVGAEKDTITSLRAPTHFGRPHWDKIFPSISRSHPDADVGVFFCGPVVLSKQLHTMCNKYSSPSGTRFFYGNENF